MGITERDFLMSKSTQKTRILWGIICVATAIAAAMQHRSWTQTEKAVIESNKKIITEVANDNAKRVSSDHSKDRDAAKALAEAVGSLSDDEIHKRVKAVFALKSDRWLKLRTVGVAYADGDLIRYRLQDDKVFEEDLEYDFHKEDEERGSWFRNLMKTDLGGETWLEPYYGSQSKTFILEYGVPFADKKGRKAGVVYLNYSIEHLRELLSQMQLGPTGYAFIAKRTKVDSEEVCKIVAHPYPGYLHLSVAEAYGPMADEIRTAVRNSRITQTSVNKHPVWFHGETLEGMGDHYLVIVLDRQAMHGIAVEQGREITCLSRTQSTMIAVVLWGISLFAGISFTLIGLQDPGKRRTAMAGSFAVICLLAVVCIWALYLGRAHDENMGYVLLDPGMAEATLERLYHQDQHTEFQARSVGIFVQSMKFTSPYEVSLTGYLWQEKGGTENATIAFTNDSVVFPESESLSITKKYETDDRIGFYFETVLRQPFDYTNYPFDTQDIWIRMWPPDFADEQAVLKPDFAGYSRGPGKTPKGIESDIVLEGWDVEQTFFSFVKREYSSNFGIKAGEETINRPELYFNIRVKRLLGGVMISHVLPISIVAILLFGVVMIKTEDPNKSGLLGFSVATVLGYCASLFFVLIVSHISLRNTLATPHFVYLEGFYFIMYCQLLLVSMYDLCFVFSKPDSLIRRDSGSLQKLLYWPVLLSLVLGVTFFSFF